MEEPMNGPTIPLTDSIKELAEFWDTHDITDFDEQMEEVERPVFQQGTTVRVHLTADEAKEVERLASANRMGCEQLLRKWALEKIGNA